MTTPSGPTKAHTIPSPPDWPDPYLTSVEMNKISTMLSFLSFRAGGFCQLTNTVPHDIPPDSDYPIAMENEEVDRDGGHSDQENTSRYVVKTPGNYLIAGTAALAVNGTGFRASKLMVNGGEANPITLAITQRAAMTGIEPFMPVGPRIARLAVSDYVELRVRQNSGNTIQTSVADGGSSLTVVWIGA
ncbi:hypothetical protein FF36_01888 [Frankia torreyi]|uniref:Uncharacterized protein n=1 Tax=Frankia torreyi TaxID=1856 RepID=A0A0D8BHH8_9ACTN|nr:MULTISPECIES: hypothetical protein [Frankia]KJE23703.1 hypothetical protein FF36_01888 [Frankia torreyi]KQM05685.1 hypothetical protein FF86_1014103 [Frankia sp. CpI1-P]